MSDPRKRRVAPQAELGRLLRAVRRESELARSAALRAQAAANGVVRCLDRLAPQLNGSPLRSASAPGSDTPDPPQLPDVGDPVASPPDAQRDLLKQHGFLTNDLVVVEEILGVGERRWLTLNGAPSIKLHPWEFLLVVGLGRHALDAERKGEFIAVPQLLQAIERIGRGSFGSQFEAIWPHPVDTDIHKAISKLRDKIREAGGNPQLIESAPKRGQGYRFSTPACNIRLKLQPGRCGTTAAKTDVQ